jgi:hypothetical protein
MRYIGSYNDDSETTIEKYGLAQTLAAPVAPGTLAAEEGEEIAAWTVFDFSYGVLFGDFAGDGWRDQHPGRAPARSREPAGLRHAHPRSARPDGLGPGQWKILKTKPLCGHNDPAMALLPTRESVHGERVT